MLKNFLTMQSLERKALKAEQPHDVLIRERFAALGYDDYSYSGDGNGSGDALASILSAVGAGASAYAAASSAPQYSPLGVPSVPNSSVYSGVSSHAPTMGSNSMLWIIVLVIVGFFAYKQL